ncbi:PREDICTED: probable peroxisomal acyl-coenzyme A oxidase 1 [Bactrocera latifrons]|uniref:probable peroxisomal acyl-coenzyme A oxidase 1 n=1 Tax=Bactrocera latifrons TaxID=174628 RepID=UPI0008DD562C|nr:PREDICTED: probable peroxisomal acyl-coenzyme A oxidase 1 [Bactrocera latifrons]XP_018789529.1 PREDICTED: probable peroxisomal acyl-coenzyme A oxidase 1 [Bactrocera latifrons]
MPTSKSLIPARVNPDLEKERRSPSFSVEEFQHWWYGGADKLKDKREIETYLYKNLRDGHLHDYLSHEDVYHLAVKDVTEAAVKLRKLQEIRNPGGNDIWPKLLYSYVSWAMMPANHPFATHITMFVDVLFNQGTPEQIEKFAKPAANCNIIGTYAQTELAHGTNVRGIETRADYDRKTDEFVLNTPNLQAYKWWPGGLGHTANHAMVVAQLYIDGKHHGIQMFIVQLRDLDTHMPLPGVDIGEIGRKLGMAGVNQGFLGFKNVRIPRTNMLMRNAKVLPDGSFVASPVSRLNYMTMVYTRCLIVDLSSNSLLQAATIATRYSAVRRQSPINANEPEPQIIDHVTQQQKLFSEIANGIAYRLCVHYMWEMYDLTQKEIANGDYKRMTDMHIISCGLKVLSSTDGSFGIERLRLACGGHGYLTSTNFSNIYGNIVAAYTYEGENTVLLLQVGRYLVKTWLQLMQGKQMPPLAAYLAEMYGKSEMPPWNDSLEYMVKLLQFTATNKTRVAFENLTKRVADGQTQEEAANNTGIELTQAAELHARQFVASVFLDQITGTKSSKRSKALNSVLENILELYLVQTVQRHMHDILRFTTFSDDNLRSLQRRLELSLKKFRPDAVCVCDGFDFHDRVLNSTLGCYDGNVYERLMEAARKSPLNQKPVPDSFEKILKPFLKSNL